MSRSLLLLVLILLINACSTSQRSLQNNTKEKGQTASLTHDAGPDSLLTDLQPKSLLDLPRSDQGEIVLSEGYYEAEFRSYCLQPGTPDPSDQDAYVMQPLSGQRKDIVEDILRGSLDRPDLPQRDVQLLLWSAVSGSSFNNLPASVKYTARELLTPRQVFTLQGGMMGVVRTVAASFPESGNNTFSDIRRLFELGNSSYEAFERLAVLSEPSVKFPSAVTREQWHKQQEGYYVRYLPANYQRTRVQVFVPEGLLDSNGMKDGNHVLLDHAAMMAVPANSNAQRLGIGAPVAEVIRKVIEVKRANPPAPRRQPPAPPSTHPKGVVLD
jgi:hypothetical protein